VGGGAAVWQGPYCSVDERCDRVGRGVSGSVSVGRSLVDCAGVGSWPVREGLCCSVRACKMLGGGDIGECASGEVWDSSIRKGDSTAFVVGACGCAGCSAEVCSYRNGGSAALIVGVGGCAGCLVEVWGFGKGGSAALVVCVGGCARYC